MANWNKSNTEIARVFLPPEEDGVPKVYEGVIRNISDVYKANKFNSEEQDDRIRIEIITKENKEDVVIPCFVNFVLSKGSGAYSPSKLYTILEKAGVVKEAFTLDTEEAQVDFLRNKLGNRKIKFIPKTINAKDSEKRYSVVDKITKFETEIIDEPSKEPKNEATEEKVED